MTRATCRAAIVGGVLALSACVLRPELAGRACDDEHPCVAGYTCHAGTCVTGPVAELPLDDAGSTATDAGLGADGGSLVDSGALVDGGSHVDGGSLVDGGSFVDGGSLVDGGVQVDAGELCPAPLDDESWLASFSISPAWAPPPAANVVVQWDAPGMQSCSVRWLEDERAALPAVGSTTVHTQYLSRTFILRCSDSAGETFEASRVFRMGPRVLDLDVGGNRTCVVLEGGVVKCWGSMGSEIPGTVVPGGIIGDEPSETGAGLLRVPLNDLGGDPAGNDNRAVRVFVGNRHNCVLLDDGRVKCWGINTSGELGTETDAHALVMEGWESLPAALLSETPVTLGINSGQSCAVFADGSVGCWGRGGTGELGAPYPDGQAPGQMPGSLGAALPRFFLDASAKVRTLVSAPGFLCALLDDGQVKCWGSNGYGQLGLGDTYTRGDQVGEVGPGSAAVPLGAAAQKIDVGHNVACALVEGQGVKCWGQNYSAQLGQEPTGDAGPEDIGDDPGEVAALSPIDLGAGTVTDIAIGSGHGCAVIGVGGIIKCWGRNSYGQLGVGDAEDRGDDVGELGAALEETEVPGYPARVSAGSQHTCARGESGEVYCWGRNNWGQLGLGDTEDRGDEAGEMGSALPPLDFGPLVDEAFTLDGVRAALERQGCTSCHAKALAPTTRAEPPLDGCAPERVSAGDYPLAGASPSSAEGALRCLDWHLTEECSGEGAHARRVDPRRPERSLLLHSFYCASRTCAEPAPYHPSVEGLEYVSIGYDFAYLFQWIARGAPGL